MKNCKIWALSFKDEMKSMLFQLFENSIFKLESLSYDDIAENTKHPHGPDALILNFDYYNKNLESWLNVKDFAYRANIPLIFIGSRKDAEEEIRTLELGADDFLSLEISPRLCQSRVKAKTRQICSVY